MYCLTKMCYVCLKQKDRSLVNINSSLSVNKDIIHIIGYLPFNLGWLKTKRIILICDECCRRLRETYQLLAMCLKNSAVLQGYMDKMNTASAAANEAELRVHVKNKPNDINEIKCEIKLEEEVTYSVGPIIAENEDAFVNVDGTFVKDEDTWKREAVDDEEEPPMDSNSTESNDKDLDTETAVNSSTHDTDTVAGSSEATSTQGHATSKKEPNTPAKKSYKCSTCSKSFSKKSNLQAHTRVHTGEKPHKCAICGKCFSINSNLARHTLTHTGEKPYACSECGKGFNDRLNLVCHMRTHTGEKPYACSECEKCFSGRSSLRRHIRIHTGEKRHECSACKKCFNERSSLVRHIRTHTGEKPFKCSKCRKCFASNSNLVSHMRTHTGEKPGE